MPAPHDPDNHGGDALDSFRRQDHVLAELDVRWHGKANAWERGTLVKLVLEHFAVREAALEVLADHLDDDGRSAEATPFMDGCEDRRGLLAALDRAAQGREPAALAASAEVEQTVEAILARRRKEAEQDHLGDELDRLFAERRSELPSARAVRKHAPTRPGAHAPRWYDGLGIASRVHAGYDRMRGFPWPDSAPFMDGPLAKPFDDEAPV